VVAEELNLSPISLILIGVLNLISNRIPSDRVQGPCIGLHAWPEALAEMEPVWGTPPSCSGTSSLHMASATASSRRPVAG
jgi:hypothetical protein